MRHDLALHFAVRWRVAGGIATQQTSVYSLIFYSYAALKRFTVAYRQTTRARR